MQSRHNHTGKTLAACALALTVGSVASPFVYGQAATDARTDRAEQRADPVQGADRANRVTDSKATAAEHPVAYRASMILGHEVQNDREQDLGEIQDLVLDTTRGEVAYVVLSFGGWLGIGDDYFAIPMSAFHFNTAPENAIRLDVPQSQLENATGFDQDNWPNMADREWARATYTHYEKTPYWESDDAESNESARPNAAINQEELWVHQASELIGLDVMVQSSDTEVGEVTDIIVSGKGKVIAVVIDHGGEIGSGGDLAAVPWQALTVDREEETLRLKGATSQLATLTFDADNWPDFVSSDWRERFDGQFPGSGTTDRDRSERVSTPNNK